jgi:hypothetical protein
MLLNMLLKRLTKSSVTSISRRSLYRHRVFSCNHTAFCTPSDALYLLSILCIQHAHLSSFVIMLHFTRSHLSFSFTFLPLSSSSFPPSYHFNISIFNFPSSVSHHLLVPCPWRRHSASSNTFWYRSLSHAILFMLRGHTIRASFILFLTTCFLCLHACLFKTLDMRFGQWSEREYLQPWSDADMRFVLISFCFLLFAYLSSPCTPRVDFNIRTGQKLVWE